MVNTNDKKLEESKRSEVTQSSHSKSRFEQLIKPMAGTLLESKKIGFIIFFLISYINLGPIILNSVLFFFFFFILFYYREINKMLSQGLSHVIFNASYEVAFDSSLRFYEALGFKVVSNKVETSEEKVAWLKLSSATEGTTESTIKVVLNASAIPQRKPAGDIDWSLEENSMAFAINNIQVCIFYHFILFYR